MSNIRKHGIDFADAVSSGRRLLASRSPTTSGEKDRFVTIGISRLDDAPRCLRPATHRVRIISARKVTRQERRAYERSEEEANTTSAKESGVAIVQIPAGKTRITIRSTTTCWRGFGIRCNAAGGGNYQKLINLALREHVSRQPRASGGDSSTRAPRGTDTADDKAGASCLIASRVDEGCRIGRASGAGSRTMKKAIRGLTVRRPGRATGSTSITPKKVK